MNGYYFYKIFCAIIVYSLLTLLIFIFLVPVARQVLIPMFIAMLFSLLCIIFYEKYYEKNNIIPLRTMEEYEWSLKKYLDKNKFIEYLENKHVRMFMHNFEHETEIRIINKKNNKMYNIISKNIIPTTYIDEYNLLLTCWGIIQMYFSKDFTFNSLIIWVNSMDNIIIKKAKY